MKSRFHFFNAGFRSKKGWNKARAGLIDACRSRGAYVEIDRSNESLMRGIFYEENTKTIVIYNKDGAPETVELKTFARCEFLFRVEDEILAIKNPSRGAFRSLINCYQDASFFEVFAESPKWELWQVIEALEGDTTDRTISKIEVSSYPYPNGLEGNLVITGKLNSMNLDRFRKGKLIRVHGSYCGNKPQRFVVSSDGTLKVSGNMTFDEALLFTQSWRQGT